MSGEFTLVEKIAWILLVVGIYFLPYIVALCREKRNSTAIAVLNLFLGWTGVAWVIALVWAVMQDKKV